MDFYFSPASPEILCHPNIPKPLHGLNPRTIKGQSWWDEERQKAYKKTYYHCAACWTHKSKALYHQWLEAHEIYKIDYKKGTAEMIEIVALCHACHNYIHDGRLQVLLDKKEITQEKYDQIIERGDEILNFHNLSLKEYDGPVAEWSKWRLILDGVEYKSKFKNFQQWREFYNK